MEKTLDAEAVSFLEGERVSLVPARANSEILRWINNPEVCQFNSHAVFPTTELPEIKNGLVLSILAKEGASRSHIGNISLQKIDWISRSAELAILIGAKSIWGKGYGKEASLLVCRHGFNALNLHRIYCGTPEKNIGMQKIALALGMRREGISRQAFYKNGEYADILQYGILREEFINAPGGFQQQQQPSK